MNETTPPLSGARGAANFGWDRKLRETDDFSSVFRFKCAQRGVFLDVHACPNSLGFPRLGLVVAKRILPHAVDRNRVKRVLREVFRLHQTELGGLDIVFRLKAAAPVEDAGAYAREALGLLRAVVRRACRGTA